MISEVFRVVLCCSELWHFSLVDRCQFLPWRYRQYIPAKHWFIVMTQKMTTWKVVHPILVLLSPMEHTRHPASQEIVCLLWTQRCVLVLKGKTSTKLNKRNENTVFHTACPFLRVLWLKFCMHFLSVARILHTPPILFSFVPLSQWYSVKSTNCEAPY